MKKTAKLTAAALTVFLLLTGCEVDSGEDSTLVGSDFTVIETEGLNHFPGTEATDPAATEATVPNVTVPEVTVPEPTVTVPPATEPSAPATETESPTEHTHQWGAWKEQTAPGCETEGVRLRICSICGAGEKEPIPAVGHSWDSGKENTTDSACGGGEKIYTCQRCAATKSEAIPASHSFREWYYEEYTFQQAASSGKVYDRISHRKVRVCSACGYKETGGTPDHSCKRGSINHTVTKLEDATCSQMALYRSTCTICGWSTEYRASAYASHTWTEETRHLTDYTEYTNELDVTISTCTACGKKYIGYTKGEGFSDYNRYRNTVSVSQGTAYCGAYPADDDDALLNHPTWQMVYRNFVYDSDGYVKQFTVYWHDTAGNRYSQVINCGAGDMEAWFADYGVTVPDGYAGAYMLKVSGSKVVPYKISWTG